MEKLPIDNFQWLNEEEVANFDIHKLDLDSDIGYFVECDLKYPKKLHNKHNSLPLAPEVLQVNFENLSPYAKQSLLESDNQKKYKDVKLLTHFNDRIEYV